jgi:hypothetical protein
MDFPGLASDMAIDLSAANVPASTSELTITAWGNPDAVGTADEQVIIAKSNGSGNVGPFKMQVEESPDVLRGLVNDNSDDGATAISAATWTFFAMVYDSVDKTLYINAVQDATEASADGDVNTNADPFKIGAVDAGTNVREFDGLLDDIRVYTRALSLAELQTIYTLVGQDNIVNDLLWRWRMNELSPGTAATIANSIIDLAGNQNGDPENSPVYAEGILR